MSLSLLLALALSAAAQEVPPIGPAAEVPLECRPDVQAAMSKAWDMVGRGRRDYEAAFRIDRVRTAAIVHTHPDISVHHPADKDFDSRVPNYVISRKGLTVTIPGTKDWRFVRRRWDRPCE